MKNNINIYLDIDGVLLANELNPAKHAPEFIEYVLTNYPESTYWLTTHCQGNADIPLQHIGHLFDNKTNGLMKNIKPTSWDSSKTQAIDFTKPFLWFDDDLYPEERTDLRLHGVEDNFIHIDLAGDPKQLGKFIKSFPVPISLTMFEPEEIRTALKIIAKHGKAYTTLLQKELRIGYARALNLMIKLEYDGYIEIPRNNSFGKVNFDIDYNS